MARKRPTLPVFTLPSYIFVDNCDEGRWENRPLTQRELRAAAALGSVLDRRAWWIKWTRNPPLRATWLAEVEAELVRATVEQLVVGWAGREHYKTVSYKLLAMCKQATTLAQRIPHTATDVLYPMRDDYPFDDGGDFESDGEGQDDEEEEQGGDQLEGKTETSINTEGTRSLNEISPCQIKANPFVQILWYAKMEVVRDRLRERPPGEWTTEWLHGVLNRIESVDRNTVLQRVYSLIEVTRNHETPAMTRPLVHEYFPDEQREHVRELLVLHLRKIRRSILKTLREVETVLQVTIDTLNLGSDKPLAQGDRACYVPGAVRRTWLSDNAVPPRLKAKLLGELAQPTATAARNGDRDPELPVYRLLDPALHCAVVGETQLVDIRHGGGTVPTRMRDTIFAAASGVLEIENNHESCPCEEPFDDDSSDEPGEEDHPKRLRCKETATYVRIPSEIDVSSDATRAAFRSYINNLHPEDHTSLYKSLASLFVRFVPLFDQVISALDDSFYHVESKAVVEPMLTAALGGTRPSSSLRRLVPPGLLEAIDPRFTLKGSRCQVIVQIDEMILTPSEPRYTGEPWQIDGIDAERIVATGIYCASCENITEPQCSFRVPVEKPRFDRWANVAVDIVYQLHDGDPLHQEIGGATLKEDRCIVYPSIYEHTMHPFQFVDTTMSGRCTLVKFLLVDPVLSRVVSTETIPPQQDAWLKRELQRIITRDTLPDLVVSHILSFMRLGQTHEQGLDVRRKLLEDRAGIVDKRVEDREYRYRW